MPLVKSEIRAQTGILTLDDAPRRNALSEALVDGLIEGLAGLQAARVPVVILRAADGAQVWSAGHNIRELPRTHRDPLGYADALERLLRAVQSYPGPVIAMVQGSVWGGACDLVMTCDLCVGDDSAAFAITPAKLGIPYNSTGILHFMNRLPLNIAKEMFFTADLVPAERAERVGILNHRVPAPELFAFTLGLAARIAARSALSVQVIKEQFRLLAEAHPLSPAVFERIQGLRRQVYDSHDYEEGIQSFIEKRPPTFRGE